MARSAAPLLLAAALVAGCGSSDKEAATNPPPAEQISVPAPKKRTPKAVKAAPVKLDPLLKTLPLADRVSQVLLVGPADAQAPTEGYGGAALTEPALISSVRQTLATRGRVQPLVVAARPTAAGPAKIAGYDLVLGPPADVGVAGGSAAGPTLGTDAATVTRRVRTALATYKRAGVLAAPGHLPGQGTASGNPDTDTATVGLSLDELRQRDLRPFRALARTAPAVQLSGAVYAGYDGVTPATLLPEVATTLARGELGFGGALVSVRPGQRGQRPRDLGGARRGGGPEGRRRPAADPRPGRRPGRAGGDPRRRAQGHDLPPPPRRGLLARARAQAPREDPAMSSINPRRDEIVRVSTLELFFDLVFVLTITQLTALLEHHPDGKTLFQVAVMLGVIWWMYSGYVWLTNTVAADTTLRRNVLLGGMAAFLIVSLSIPRGVARRRRGFRDRLRDRRDRPHRAVQPGDLGDDAARGRRA